MLRQKVAKNASIYLACFNSSTAKLIDQLIDLPEASLACQEPQLDIILNE